MLIDKALTQTIAENIVKHLQAMPDATDVERQQVVADIVECSVQNNLPDSVPAKVQVSDSNARSLVFETRGIAGQLTLAGGPLTKTHAGQIIDVIFAVRPMSQRDESSR